jgi:polysaccharide pyruvyl transferase WcaK-like protein
VTDLLLQLWTAALIEASNLEHIRGKALAWRRGEPLRLLFAGYNGARNTGSDVRVQEMLRQVRHVLGADRVHLSVLTLSRKWTLGYFEDADHVRLPNVFPRFLYEEVPKHHGVVACEGSMFKSRFADALTTMMIGALGMAAARNKLSVGYGAEAGHMSRSLRFLVRRYCTSSLVITRNEESEKILRRLKVPTAPGTDTAWTFEPRGPEYGKRALESAGWDGKTPVLAICPINPFWWPVRASVSRGLAHELAGAYRESHYRSVYFHASGPAVTNAYERYLSAVGGAVKEFRSRRAVFPVVVAMERLDADACRRLSARLDDAPVFASEEHDMFEIVSVLRACRFLVSSRFHAIVTTMPALVPSAGITMDERIRNLMIERGQENLLLEVDDPDLEPKLHEVLETLWREREAIQHGIGASVARNLRRMAKMGLFFEEEVARRFPEFGTRSGLVPWEEYLPPLSPELESILSAHTGVAPSAPRVHRTGARVP